MGSWRYDGIEILLTKLLLDFINSIL